MDSATSSSLEQPLLLESDGKDPIGIDRLRTSLLSSEDEEEKKTDDLQQSLLCGSAADSPDDPDRNDGGAAPDGEGGDDESDSDDDPWRNRNVRLSLILCILSGIADSIWGAVVLSGFLFALGKAMGMAREDNTLVGAAEAVQGVAQLLFALPIGVIADKIGKAKVVRFGAGLVLVAVGVTLWALRASVHRAEDGAADDADRAYVMMLVALGLWGVVGGITNGPSQALFADSMRKGKRSEMLTWLYSCYLMSSVVGPVVSIVLLLTVSGDAEDWSLEEIYPVFFVGVCLEIPVAVVMFFFSDKHVVKEEEEAENEEESRNASDTGYDASEDGSRPNEQNPCGCFSKAAIPYVLFFSSFVVSLGSGASVKYFPLFFKELGLTSAEVQGVFLAVPISISAFSFVTQRVSTRLGRIETTILFDIIGTSLLFFMTWLSRDEDHLDAANKVFIIVVYLLRTGVMNGSYPLLESILMDSVPSNRRARWKSLESIASFGWTGSALAGGVLSDSHSYRFTFSITAGMQLFGAFMLIPIQPFVESEVESDKKSASRTDENGNDPSEPLFEP